MVTPSSGYVGGLPDLQMQRPQRPSPYEIAQKMKGNGSPGRPQELNAFYAGSDALIKIANGNIEISVAENGEGKGYTPIVTFQKIKGGAYEPKSDDSKFTPGNAKLAANFVGQVLSLETFAKNEKCELMGTLKHLQKYLDNFANNGHGKIKGEA